MTDYMECSNCHFVIPYNSRGYCDEYYTIGMRLLEHYGVSKVNGYIMLQAMLAVISGDKVKDIFVHYEDIEKNMRGRPCVERYPENSTEKEEDKDSASYFMTKMTQEEYEERMGKRPVVPYKFNKVERKADAVLDKFVGIIRKHIEKKSPLEKKEYLEKELPRELKEITKGKEENE